MTQPPATIGQPGRTATGTLTEADWWRGAVIYQIYPRSFADSNGDGIGDLRGIAERLDYIAALGVDAIWISPFFKSPMRDFGYDVSDFRAVDPIFGTLADFDELLARAHALGLKVLIDQVLSHTSDEHPWFRESRASRDNDRADWYVWADPQPDGTPPNNWLSVFGGSAWQWDTRRRQYYLHNFLASQPDLNLHHPEVRRALLHDLRFWLERGVDGFRFDAVNFYFHDAALRSNPPWGERPKADASTPDSNPYALQRHVYDKSRPENLAFLRQLRALMDEFPGTTSVGEIGDDDALGLMAAYTGGQDKLHMAYTSGLVAERLDAAHLRSVVETLEARIGSGWPCWSVGNHDATRVMTRVSPASLSRSPEQAAALAVAVSALLSSLRGSVCLYQGEELALPEAQVPFERLQDPYGIAFWPEYTGRDGCRTPMPWRHDAPHAGFSAVEPWLPVGDAHVPLAVDRQLADPNSCLHATRRFLRWRQGQPALRRGTIRFLDAPPDCVVFIRVTSEVQMLVAFNLSASARTVPVPPGAAPVAVEGHGLGGRCDGGEIQLPPYSAYFGRLPTPRRARRQRLEGLGRKL